MYLGTMKGGSGTISGSIRALARFYPLWKVDQALFRPRIRAGPPRYLPYRFPQRFDLVPKIAKSLTPSSSKQLNSLLKSRRKIPQTSQVCFDGSWLPPTPSMSMFLAGWPMRRVQLTLWISMLSRQLHFGCDRSNIEIGGRGLDLELISGAQTCTKIWLQRLGPSRHFHVSCPSHFRFHVRPFSASISGPFPLSFPAHFRFHSRFHSRFHFHFHFRSISASISAFISTFISGPFPLPFSAFHFRSICGSFPVHFRFHSRFHFCFHLWSISGSFPAHFQFISASISAFMSGSFPL